MLSDMEGNNRRYCTAGTVYFRYTQEKRTIKTLGLIQLRHNISVLCTEREEWRTHMRVLPNLLAPPREERQRPTRWKTLIRLAAPRTRRQARLSDAHSNAARSNTETTNTGDNNGRVTTREIWRMIDGLKETIAYQTELIQSTKNELLEVKHDQNVLHTQNEKLHEEVRALRAQIDALPSTPVAKSWAAVAASHPPPQPNHQRTDKDRNCVRISTQRSFVDPRDNDKSEQNTFGRYLPTETANTYIRTALSNTPSTQDAQVAGVGTTKTGYVIRFKDTESAEAARNNSGMAERARKQHETSQGAVRRRGTPDPDRGL